MNNHKNHLPENPEKLSSIDSHSLKIRLNACEEERLNQLAEQSHLSKAAVLKRSLCCSDPSSAIIRQLVESSVYAIDRALDQKEYSEVRKELMNLCLSLNSLSWAKNESQERE